MLSKGKGGWFWLLGRRPPRVTDKRTRMRAAASARTSGDPAERVQAALDALMRGMIARTSDTQAAFRAAEAAAASPRASEGAVRGARAPGGGARCERTRSCRTFAALPRTLMSAKARASFDAWLMAIERSAGSGGGGEAVRALRRQRERQRRSADEPSVVERFAQLLELVGASRAACGDARVALLQSLSQSSSKLGERRDLSSPADAGAVDAAAAAASAAAAALGAAEDAEDTAAFTAEAPEVALAARTTGLGSFSTAFVGRSRTGRGGAPEGEAVRRRLVERAQRRGCGRRIAAWARIRARERQARRRVESRPRVASGSRLLDGVALRAATRGVGGAATRPRLERSSWPGVVAAAVPRAPTAARGAGRVARGGSRVAAGRAGKR